MQCDAAVLPLIQLQATRRHHCSPGPSECQRTQKLMPSSRWLCLVQSSFSVANVVGEGELLLDK